MKAGQTLELRIKHSFSSGLQLTGYVYFAQKMRQLKALDLKKLGGKKKKVGEIVQEIKAEWESLTEAERIEYEKKAEFVSTKMKANKFKTYSLDNKHYA